MISKSHNFFLLLPSPWALIVRVNSFRLFFSFILFIKFNILQNFLLNVVILRIVSFSWWIFYRNEFNLEGKNSSALERGLKFAIILFISSEIFFFFSFFWSYFHFYLSPTLETSIEWPPFGVLIFDYSNVPLINTLILISSGVTVTIRHFYLIKGNAKKKNYYLFLTCLLGIMFTFLQLQEYIRSFFRIRDASFGTTFFILTGFHGIHVIIGSIFLMCTLLRRLKIISRKKEFLRFELASWYWHFVDVVWLFLYFIIYYINF